MGTEAEAAADPVGLTREQTSAVVADSLPRPTPAPLPRQSRQAWRRSDSGTAAVSLTQNVADARGPDAREEGVADEVQSAGLAEA